MAIRDINLIPAEIPARRYTLRHVSFWAGCLIISLFFIGCATLYYTHVYLAKKRAAIAAMKSSPAHLNARIEEARQMQAEISNLNQRRSVLQSIVNRNQSYTAVVVKLTDLMNTDTWLTQLSLDSGQDKEGRAQLKLTGVSFSNEKLGDFLNRLASETLFKGVELKYSREGEQSPSGQSGASSGRLIQFQIDCYLSKDNRG